jgi:hypothetical protein
MEQKTAIKLAFISRNFEGFLKWDYSNEAAIFSQAKLDQR